MQHYFVLVRFYSLIYLSLNQIHVYYNYTKSSTRFV